jgi:hypothetical protein
MRNDCHYRTYLTRPPLTSALTQISPTTRSSCGRWGGNLYRTIPSAARPFCECLRGGGVSPNSSRAAASPRPATPPVAAELQRTLSRQDHMGTGPVNQHSCRHLHPRTHHWIAGSDRPRVAKPTRMWPSSTTRFGGGATTATAAWAHRHRDHEGLAWNRRHAIVQPPVQHALQRIQRLFQGQSRRIGDPRRTSTLHVRAGAAAGRTRERLGVAIR